MNTVEVTIKNGHADGRTIMVNEEFLKEMGADEASGDAETDLVRTVGAAMMSASNIRASAMEYPESAKRNLDLAWQKAKDSVMWATDAQAWSKSAQDWHKNAGSAAT